MAPAVVKSSEMTPRDFLKVSNQNDSMISWWSLTSIDGPYPFGDSQWLETSGNPFTGLATYKQVGGVWWAPFWC